MFFSVPFTVRLLTAAAVAMLAQPAVLWGQIYFDAKQDSRLWLEGSSTVHQFDCVARSIQGTAFIDGIRPADSHGAGGEDKPDGMTNAAGIRNTERQASDQKLHILLKIPVRSFDCGRSRMNRDMYEALKSDRYDYITFAFEDAETLPNDGSVPASLFQEGYQPFRIKGILNVAGVDRDVGLVVQGRTENEGEYHIKGRKEISMKDFEIDPPTALRGLVRAHDDLTVFFDLHVTETGRE